MFNTPFSRIALSLLLPAAAMMAESFSTVEYIKVTRSSPIYSTVQESIPTEHCYDVREEIGSTGNGGNNVVGALAGGAIGGILGHQIGGGHGKTAATVGGAVLGTLAGQKIASGQGGAEGPAYRIVRKCETRNTYRTREIISGYTNIAHFKGRKIRVESDEALREIPVTITYSY